MPLIKYLPNDMFFTKDDLQGEGFLPEELDTMALIPDSVWFPFHPAQQVSVVGPNKYGHAYEWRGTIKGFVDFEGGREMYVTVGNTYLWLRGTINEMEYKITLQPTQRG